MTNKNNRNPVKQMFITFPHSNIDKITFRNILLQLEPDYYKICEETHKDGTPHLHAVIRYKNKYSKSYVLKFLEKEFPDDYKRIDVETVRSIKNALGYLSKEDPTPLESGPFEETRGMTYQRVYEKISNQFARVAGYSDYTEMLNADEEKKIVFKELEDKLLDMAKICGYNDYILFIQGVLLDDPYIDYSLKELLKKVVKFKTDDPFFFISKDDITLLINQL